MKDEEIQLVELFQRIQRRLAHRLTKIGKTGNLSMTEMMVLWTLGKRRLCRASELAEKIGVPASTLTGVLDRLESQGYLQRVADSHDRRSIQLQATEKLDTFIGEGQSQANSLLVGTFDGLPPERLHQLVADLRIVLNGLEDEDGCGR